MELDIVENIRVQNLLINNRILIIWNKAVSQTPEAEGYKIYRAFSIRGIYTLIDTVSLNSTQYVDTPPLSLDDKYYYKIVLYRGEEESNIDLTEAVTDVSIDFFDQRVYSAYLTSGQIIRNEIPEGLIDGENNVYSTQYFFKTKSLEVYLNGNRLIYNIDYTENNNLGFTLDIPPSESANLVVDYIKI